AIATQAVRSEEITIHVTEEMTRLRAKVAAASKSLDEMAHMSVGTLEASRAELESSLGELTKTHSQMESTLAACIAAGQRLTQEISRSVMALQFEDPIGQRLTHVADELAEMRKNVPLPLGYLAKETPVLGAARREEVSARLQARYTMEAERNTAQTKLGA